MNDDFRDILRLLLEQGAEFVIVGAHALAVHGAARATGDIDRDGPQGSWDGGRWPLCAPEAASEAEARGRLPDVESPTGGGVEHQNLRVTVQDRDAALERGDSIDPPVVILEHDCASGLRRRRSPL